jgi:type II secretory pathway pseudopilin PulG
VKRDKTKRGVGPGRTFRSNKGLTLLELILALMVLQVALVAFAQFITRALDYSRQVRRMEMSQILAQAKMEELVRTLSTDYDQREGLLNERPGSFGDLAFARPEDVSPFRWIAEVAQSETTPGLLEVTLRIYVVAKRIREEKPSEPVDDFYLREDRKRFTYQHMLHDGSLEVVSGKEKFTLSSAVAVP